MSADVSAASTQLAAPTVAGLTPNAFESAMMSGAQDGTLAMSQLAEFEDLFARVNSDQSALIHGILKQDSKDLAEVLAETERRQETIFDQFIGEYTQQIPLLCAMFDEITRCEGKLLEFESDIAAFQERLTSTAEGIGRMQRETVQLRTQVRNRQEVGDRLKQVYEALHETERFTETIAGAAGVDEQFLLNIRQLESKIAFLADNEELAGSAIEKEMRPRLVAAAQKAGDKLHEFIVRRLASLTAENANIGLHQQAVLRSGQYAFSFLAKYNTVIADEITAYYTQIMTDVYTRITRTAVRQYEDTLLNPDSSNAGGQRRTAFEPFATVETVNALSSNGARFVDPRTLPHLNRVIDVTTSVTTPYEKSSGAAGAGGAGAGGAGLAAAGGKREKSISDSIRGFFSRGSSEAAAAGAAAAAKQRPAVFADYVHVLQGLDVSTSTRTMNFDPLVAQMLSKSSCWAYSLASILVTLINSVAREGGFLSNFFFFVAGAGGATEREEAMLRRIFEPSLAMLLGLVRNQCAVSNDPVALLTLHRVAELCRNFLTQCCNPAPIMLLTAPLEQVFIAINHRISVELMDTHLENLRAFASCAPFRKFNIPAVAAAEVPAPPGASAAGAGAAGAGAGGAPGGRNGSSSNALPLAPAGGAARFVDLVQTDRQLAALLGPNDVVRRFASAGGQLACINGLKLEGSRVCASSLAESERVVYDENVSDKLMAAVSLMANIVESCSSAHTTALAKAICKVNSFGHIYSVWRQTEPPPGPQQQLPASAASPSAAAPAGGDAMDISSGTKHHHHGHHQQQRVQLIPDKDRALVANTSSYTLVSRECRLLVEVLKLAISEFVAVDVQTTDIFAPFVGLLEKYPSHVAAATAAAAAAAKLQQLQQQQQGGAAAAGEDSGAATAATSSASTAPTPTSASSAAPCSEQDLLAVLVPFHKGWVEALGRVVQRLRVFFADCAGLVISEYLSMLVERVRDMHALVTKFYAKSAAVKSKTVGPATFVSEMKRLHYESS